MVRPRQLRTERVVSLKSKEKELLYDLRIFHDIHHDTKREIAHLRA